MLRFVKDAIRELKHVVWPTRKETQKYFGLVLALIIAFGIYLFIFSQAFSELLFGLRENFGSGQTQSQDIDFDVSDIFFDGEVPEEGVFLDDDIELDGESVELDIGEDLGEIDPQE